MKKNYNSYTVKQLKQMIADRKIFHVGLLKRDYVNSLEKDDQKNQNMNESEIVESTDPFHLMIVGMQEIGQKMEKTFSELEKTKLKFNEVADKCLNTTIARKRRI